MAEAKALLQNILDKKIAIENKRESIERLERALYRLSNASYSFTSKSTKQEDTADKLGRIQEEKEKCQRLAEEYQEEVTKLFYYMTKLSDPLYIDVLTLYYLEGKSWREVRTELCYSRTKIFNTHNKVIAELDYIIQQD